MTTTAGPCAVPKCPRTQEIRVLGYQSGPHRPDLGDDYPLCEEHYKEYLNTAQGIINPGWLQRIGVPMRPVRYCSTLDCEDKAYSDADFLGLPLCWRCYLKASAP